MSSAREIILNGQAILGIELGSTRIKAVLIDAAHKPIAAGNFGWENRLENGIWTYSLEQIWSGLQGCYLALKRDVQAKYGVTLTTLRCIGISAMMHGYLVFDSSDRLLVPFRTWRNTITGPASKALTELFNYNIPQRWSIAHLYQAILNGEAHLPDIAFMTTLAGYIHWQLTGEKTLGVGEASGMFPIDTATKQFNAEMLARFQALIADRAFPWKIADILPRAQCAGECAGTLTAKGALLLDPSGELLPGVPFCPPEGDAGTGMVATNSVAKRTGNVSAGTSVFAMLVLENSLKQVHQELDMVTTPTGAEVAMVHCNNCTSDLNAWVGIFREFAALLGVNVSVDELFRVLYGAALDGDADCGGLFACNYLSGEHITGFEEGRPLLARTPAANFTLANLMRAQLFAALATLKTGLDILFRDEGVQADEIFGHGGLFKTPLVGQKLLAAATGVPVAVMETAGEGGAWGIALLAAYMHEKTPGQSLEAFLAQQVFAGQRCERVAPNAADVVGFDAFLARYTEALAIERAAVEHLPGC